MKKIMLVCFIAFSLATQAQIQTPSASSHAMMEQVVGLTTVKVDYSRPNMRGREVFGNLVPYGKIWRTGANATTKFTVDKPVVIADKELAKGTYSIYTIPGEDMWEVIFYTDDANPLLTEFEDSKVALRTMVETVDMPMDMETFTIVIDDVMTDSAVLSILWANTIVPIKFNVLTDKEVLASIDQTLSGPASGDYFNAAVYYLNSGKDIDKAKTWMDKAMSMNKNPRFWELRQQSLVLAKAGDKKAAIEAAKKSLAGAKEAGNADYIKMNTDSLKEWGAL
ncbi:DUF2911 domain-containing protein [Leeuwenhoekiella aequorea]|uniref:DUF2911 domain-containing protein n=1 Tax=Leeuwenhoekiella aequorea TaxID=283736 RepID=UPI00352FE729|tara:strand:- start:114 stop:953 length:840 start_codon:yes stop_codon:yes gene_type:complete